MQLLLSQRVSRYSAPKWTGRLLSCAAHAAQTVRGKTTTATEKADEVKQSLSEIWCIYGREADIKSIWTGFHILNRNTEGQNHSSDPNNSCWMNSEVKRPYNVDLVVVYAIAILIHLKRWTKSENWGLSYDILQRLSENAKVKGQKRLPFPLPLGVVCPVFALGCFDRAWFGHAVLSASFTATYEERNAEKRRSGSGDDLSGLLSTDCVVLPSSSCSLHGGCAAAFPSCR